MTETITEDVAKGCETVRTSVNQEGGGVATITLSRPDAKNAMNATLRSELKAVLETVDKDDAVRVVVLTGDDEAGAFAAGADVTDLYERTPLEQREAAKRPRVYEAVANLSKPVIARINGIALGGGCELTLAADIRIASTDAKLGLPEVNLGLIPGGGGTQRLPRLVGEGTAMKMILTGEFVDATDAVETGLVDEIHEPDELDDHVYDIAYRIADKSPVTIEFAKKAISTSSKMGLDDGIEYEAELFAQLLATSDGQEGVAAFVEDRDPKWQGK